MDNFPGDNFKKTNRSGNIYIHPQEAVSRAD